MDVNDSVVRWNVFIDNQNQNKTAHTVNQLNTLASMMVVNSVSDRLDAYLNTSHTFNLATKKTPRATKQRLNNAKKMTTSCPTSEGRNGDVASGALVTACSLRDLAPVVRRGIG